MRNILLIIAVLLISTSCVVEKTQVGNYNTQSGKTTVYEKGKNLYLFWNQIPVQRIDKEINLKDYEVVVKRSFFDSVIFVGTIGICSFYTVKIKVKENKSDS